MLNRRKFFLGLIAAPAIVKVASIMPVKPMRSVLWDSGIHDDLGVEFFDSSLMMTYEQYAALNRLLDEHAAKFLKAMSQQDYSTGVQFVSITYAEGPCSSPPT